ncbi:YhjD/YihY/BrkB family envelope integrity protein [Sphingomonas sp. PAMC 26621]|uniref:YhjD/YihY/BrkB family envelope integrity protein n=1 Tax=Sphingomonas sp. PAMC 26621 TaxID=1112213 RepID=UPI000287F286|nr:YhjD/YihY/BrkB family envelope integrity protein [Sphingomonas sp. PAMC 26621]
MSINPNARNGHVGRGFTDMVRVAGPQQIGACVDDQGKNADSPWQMPRAAWIAVLKRTWAETGADNIGLIAAGVAFYGFLAIVPMLGAIVLVYGLAADPATVVHDMTELTSIMPKDVAKLIGEQLMSVVQTSDGKKGFGLLLALALALFGARNGAGAVITALNVAYEETEKRNFFWVNLLAIGITAAAVIGAMLALVAIAALGYLGTLFPNAPDFVVVLGKIAVYLLLTLVGAAAAATLYRYGPSRRHARWSWLTPGSIFAALSWLLLTIGFGIYVAQFGNYNATYGSLGAVVVTLTWLYLSSYILLFGAELNSELEHQTEQDTTAAPPEAQGDRGAWVADHVADTPETVGTATGDKPGRVSSWQGAAGGIAGGRAAAVAGLPKVGWKTSAAATVGLALLRRGRGWEGALLVAGTAALAWSGRKRARRVEAVFFDVDGTLVDSNDLHVDAWDTAFRAHGFIVDRAAIRGQIGKGGDMLVPTLLPGTPEKTVKALSDRHGKVFKQRHLGAVEPFPQAAALLEHVHASGCRVVLASSADAHEVDHYVKQLGIKRVIDARTTIDDAATSKPAGDIFAAALRKVAPVDAAATIVVGDTPFDVEAATKCGIRTVALRSGGFDDAALRAAGAIALYDDVADLLARFDTSPLAE